MPRRAVGIVRVSQVAGREGDSFASPSIQRERIVEACERDGLELIATVEELDVSGGTALERREGLRGAVEMIEAGQAEVLVAAYFDRLVRSLRVQGEVVSRIEAAGGAVLAVDVGAISEATAGQWLSATMLGMVAEYHRRTTKERVGAAQARAVARGVPPWDNVTLGYVRGTDRRFHPDPETVPLVRRAFELRAAGTPLMEIRDWLRGEGADVSLRRLQSLLGSRVVLGEINFGSLHNPTAHEAIVDEGLWRAVQRVRKTRGERPKSSLLLARQGVLRCGVCGSRMISGVQTQNGRRYPFYRCPPTLDCTRRQTISARIVEELVVARVQAELADVEGRASAQDRTREAEAALDRAQADLEAAIRAFAVVGDEPAAAKRLAELRAARDEAEAHLAQLGHLGPSVALRADDWHLLTLSERRALVRATIERVTISPGRGAERVSILAFVANTPSR